MVYRDNHIILQFFITFSHEIPTQEVRGGERVIRQHQQVCMGEGCLAKILSAVTVTSPFSKCPNKLQKINFDTDFNIDYIL